MNTMSQLINILLNRFYLVKQLLAALIWTTQSWNLKGNDCETRSCFAGLIKEACYSCT